LRVPTRPTEPKILNWIHYVHEGARFRSIHTGEMEQLHIVQGPRLPLTSGELVFEDIDYVREVDPFGDCRVDLPPGVCSIALGAFAVPDRPTPTYWPVVCIVGERERAVSWQPAGGDGRVVSDHGAVCTYDASVRAVFEARFDPEEEYLAIHDELVSTSTFVAVRAGDEIALVVFHCGLGSGAYPVWRGLDQTGQAVCAVADLDALNHYEPVED